VFVPRGPRVPKGPYGPAKDISRVAGGTSILVPVSISSECVTHLLVLSNPSNW
jgi:hypothetical protein